MKNRPTRGLVAVASALGLTVALSACGAGTTPDAGGDDESTAETAQPHGYVAGAEESAEPQNGLIYAQRSTGEVHLLDLVSGETSAFDPADGDGADADVDTDTDTGADADADSDSSLDSLLTDGRYAYASSASTGRLTVFDGGTWTVDHGDHKHYYRTDPSTVGTIAGAAGAGVASSRTFVALSGAIGDAVGGAAGNADGSAVGSADESSTQPLILDRATLDSGTIKSAPAPSQAVDGAALVVPFGENLVAIAGDTSPTSDSGAGQRTEPGTTPGTEPGTVTIVDRDGTASVTLADTCAAPAGQATARTGIVIGCADGALLVTDSSGDLGSEKIPYPGSLPAGARATSFDYRPGANYLAARVADTTVLSLDVSARAWSTATTATPIRAVTSPGDGATVLALLTDGTLASYSTTDGALVASVPLLAGGGADAAAPGSRIQIDTSRAYVNDPRARQIHEIDYADDLRLTRSFDTAITPDFLVEVGR